MPSVGQWYVCKSSLTLMRITALGEVPDVPTAFFKEWTPYGINPDCMGIWSPNYVRLWFDQIIWYEAHWATHLENVGLKPGDIFLDNETHRIWCVGSDSTRDSVHVLANWVVDGPTVLNSTRIQEGPASDPKQGPTRFTQLSKFEKLPGDS